MSSRSIRHCPLPLVKYDFNKATDRRHEKRNESLDDLFFRDTTPRDQVRTGFSLKPRDKN
jgi:hypothetical protein